MFIISGSAMRSGSSWYLNLTNDLLQMVDGPNVRELRTEANIEEIIQNKFADIGKPKYTKLLRLLVTSWQYGKFVVKTHSAPSRGMRWLGHLRLIKCTYIYRDPRDRLLSLMDMGERVRAVNDEQSPFYYVHTFEGAFQHVRQALKHRQAWAAQPHALLTRYEDLVVQPTAEVMRLAKYLDIVIKQDQAQQIVDKYTGKKLTTDAKFTNFQHGKIGRYQDVLTPEQIARFRSEMGDDLQALGYHVE